MSNVHRDDYEKIVKIYNESGMKAAMEYIEVNYGIKYPRDVLRRIKISPGYSYDATSKKIIIDNGTSEKMIFMGIDELCKPVASMKSTIATTASMCNTKDFTLELLYQELLQEKLMELSKYVKLHRYSNTILIDKTALIADGYQVSIN
jgi:hypothetical protein